MEIAEALTIWRDMHPYAEDGNLMIRDRVFTPEEVIAARTSMGRDYWQAYDPIAEAVAAGVDVFEALMAYNRRYHTYRYPRLMQIA